MNIRLLMATAVSGLIALSAPYLSTAAFAQSAQPVSVKVRKQKSGNDFVYSYEVVNNSDKAVVALRIGYDPNGAAELSALPLGWTFKVGIPAGSTSAPVGWEARVVTTEEEPLVFLEWTAEAGVQSAIQPGSIQGSFQIRIGQDAPEYSKSHFDVLLSNSKHFNGVLEETTPPDTLAPTVKVTLSPSQLWPANLKMVKVTASVAATDDIDPAPVIRLESIVCNEAGVSGDIEDAKLGTDDRSFSLRAKRAGSNKEGRIYTVTYSATDAAGNKGTGIAMVRVPREVSP